MRGVGPDTEVAPGDDDSVAAHSPFEQRWWLDAVAPGAWGEVVVERQGEVVARLPYLRKRKLGLTVLTQPPLTRFVGPWLRPSTGKYATRLGVESELMGELIENLPPHDVYRGSFVPEVTNWLPFYWAGFQATVRYTYRLPDLSDPDRLWADVGGNVRSRVRRARDSVEIRTDVCLDEVLRINRRLFERQGLQPTFDDAMAHRLDEACRKRDARQIVAGVDADGRAGVRDLARRIFRWRVHRSLSPTTADAASGAPLVSRLRGWPTPPARAGATATRRSTASAAPRTSG